MDFGREYVNNVWFYVFGLGGFIFGFDRDYWEVFEDIEIDYNVIKI